MNYDQKLEMVNKNVMKSLNDASKYNCQKYLILHAMWQISKMHFLYTDKFENKRHI